MNLGTEERDVRHCLLKTYFPAWCAMKETRDCSAFDPDWSFLTPGLSRWFLAAIKEHAVEIRNGSPELPDGSHTAYFQNNKPLLHREGVLEVAAVGMLARRYGWALKDLRFQSPWPWAFDLLAYAGSAEPRRVAIAGEAKWRQADSTRLVASLKICCTKGRGHTRDECNHPLNHHRKYEGLLECRPTLLWIIGPDAFLDAPDLVFRVRDDDRDVIQLDHVSADALAATRNPRT